MVVMAKIEAQSSIKSPPTKVYDFFKSDHTKLTKIVPQLFKEVKVVDGNAGQPGGTLQYELCVFGEKITIKLKAEKIDDSKRSISFTVLQEDNNKRNTALMIKLTINNGNVTWSLQFLDSMDVSEDVSRYAKAIINLIIKALDIYLQFS